MSNIIIKSLAILIHSGGVTFYESLDDLAASSVLELTSVTCGDSGNYTCHPVGLPLATVALNVLKGKLKSSGNRFHLL